MVLTTEGEKFYPIVRETLEKLIEGVEELRRERIQAPLKIQTYMTVSLRWLAARIPRFREQYPNISLEIISCTNHWEFDHENADVGLIYSEQDPPPGVVWQPLFQHPLLPVCSPELLPDGCKKLTAQELLDLPLLAVSAEMQYWYEWFDACHITVPESQRFTAVDTQSLAIEMSLNGDGVAMISGPFIDGDLAAGRLIKPCDLELKRGVIYQNQSNKL